MSTSLDEIRKRISYKKDELNLSYQELSDRTGLSKSTLQRYVTGDIGNLGLDKIELLADALSVTPGYLMGWEKDSNLKSLESSFPEGISLLYRASNELSEEDREKMIKMINNVFFDK